MHQPIILPHFKKQLKWYSKKYPHLKDGVTEALEHFNKIVHPHLGNNIYKIRIRTKDIPRGKNKSFRLIALIVEIQNFIVPVAIYFKGERADISKRELNEHLEMILFELRFAHALPLS